MSTIPHPERSIVARLATFETAHPSVTIWGPSQSVSGDWEAMGDDWAIQDTNPSRLLDRIAKLIDGTPKGGDDSGEQGNPERSDAGKHVP